jgi:FdhD protein
MDRPQALTAVQAVKVRPGRHAQLPDEVATEEPMEIRLAGPGQEAVPAAVTMRTPGHDFELAAGFAVTEGLIRPAQIAGVGYCDGVRDDPEARYNTVTVALQTPWEGVQASRPFVASASCGVCGKASIDDIEVACPAVPRGEASLAGSLLPLLPDRLRQAQRVFSRTGGLHAAGLFDPDGNAAVVREDVGRHNAVDKVAGSVVLGRRPDALSGWVLMLSGRVSFEIVQKAAVCGIGTIAAVSAPTSLAVRGADRLGVTLAGFVRGGSYNVYSHPERIDLDR